MQEIEEKDSLVNVTGQTEPSAFSYVDNSERKRQTHSVNHESV